MNTPVFTAPSTPGASATPLRIAIQIDFSDNWLGGLNYFKNLIYAVRQLSGPAVEFIVFTGTVCDERLRDEFPATSVVTDRMFDRYSPAWIKRKLFQKLTHADRELVRLLKHHRIDVLSHSGYLGHGSTVPTLGWVPDFQHLYLPEYFERSDLLRRDAEIARIVKECTSVIVSSQAAKEDLLRLAPHANEKVEVLRFVGPRSMPERMVDLATLEKKYGFKGKYFFLPNQYWQHKNHLAVIRAVAGLRTRGREVTVITTGKADDYRNPDFFQSVQSTITELEVAENYRVLGIIPYEDVAALMQHALCVINPSRFEGWSTTVEEAKAIKKHLLLSDIAVHREQAQGQADFFAPDDVGTLEELMWAQYGKPQPTIQQDANAIAKEHNLKREQFAQNYLDMIKRARK